MFGVTTACVERAREVLEQAGYECSSSTPSASAADDRELGARRRVVGVLDITTTELADEFVGGVLSAGRRD